MQEEQYYTATIKLLVKDKSPDNARETILEALNFVSEQDNSILEWGYVKTGDITRAFPTLVLDQALATNFEDSLDRERELKAQPRARLSEKAIEELDFLEADNEETFDNL